MYKIKNHVRTMYEMDTQRIYSIDEVATITGLTREHLARRDGQSPIDRVNETFYWRDDLGNRRDGITEQGLAMLTTYLYECGADGLGTPYQEWQSKVWRESGMATEPQATTGALTVMPDLTGDLTNLDGDFESSLLELDGLQQQFRQAISDFGGFSYNVGRAIGKQGRSQMARGATEEMAVGLQQIIEQLKKVG